MPGRPKFRKVKITGSRKPGYIRGTLSAQQKLYQSLKQLHQQGVDLLTNNLKAIIGAVEGMSLVAALKVITDTFVDWGTQVVEQTGPLVANLYGTGIKAGASEVGFSTDFGATLADPVTLDYLATQPEGLVPTLQGFVEDERAAAEQIIRAAFEEETPFDLDVVVNTLQARVPKERYKLNRIVRTETSKLVGMGRLAAWEADPQRDMYDYHWIATLDGRHKDISEKFMKDGPYAFEEVKKLWENPVATVKNRKTGKMEEQNDAYNQRCTLARTPKPISRLRDEGVAEEELEGWFG